MSRALYILFRFVEMIVGVFSRAYNTVFWKGSRHQTSSARVHVETHRGPDGKIQSGKNPDADPVWFRRRRFINGVFFWEADHARRIWENDVRNARRTLEEAGL